MKPRLLFLGAVVAAFVLAVAFGYLMAGKRERTTATPAPVASERPGDAAPEPGAAVSAVPGDVAAESPLATGIAGMLARLLRGEVSAAALEAFKQALLAADPAESIAAIRAFLATGQNARTGQDFEIAPGGGTLARSPTLRLLLLDVLGQQAKKLRSTDAAVVSRGILETKESADEWAIALRNVAWAEPQSRRYLADKVRELLAYPAWRGAPSGGMLESLDVAVFTRDATLVPALAAAREAGGELAHAVDIALDRLAEAAPLGVLTYLNTHPTTLAERPLLRADYFAKADLADGAQRAQIEIYLGRPDVSIEEKGKLLRGLVTPASFVSDTLLSAPLPADDGSARRAALGSVAAEWMKGNRFPGLRAQLLDVQSRLAH